MNGHKYLILKIAGIIWIFYLFYVTYLLFYPFQTISEINPHVLNQSYKAGETVRYIADYCKYTDAPAVVYRTFRSTDETQVFTSPAVATVSVKGCHTATIPVATDISMTPGRYYLYIEAIFKINPLREIHKKFKTNEFEITK